MDTPQQPNQNPPSQTPPSSTPPAANPPAEDKVVVIGKYKIKISRHDCIGAASCVAISPDTYKLDGENKAVLIEQSSDSPENVLLAAQSCPTKAIIVMDAATGEQVWPS